jgi:surfactin synthase thioesterase subunit
MKYFSGFCLKDDDRLFKTFLDRGDFNIAGFSLGAIKALEYVKECESRVDKVQLFSPAFFQEKDEKFKRVQLLHFQKDENAYVENFLKNIANPLNLDMREYYKKDTLENLELLLSYHYKKDMLKDLVNRGIKIELYLGEKDKIIDHKKVEEFFDEFATIYIIKNRGHILNG